MNIEEKTSQDTGAYQTEAYKIETGTADDSTEQQESSEGKKKSGILSWVRDMAIAVVLALILLQFFNPTVVRQESMENTLHDGDYIFINKKAFTFGSLEHGDIIVFHTDELDESGKDKKLIKRAIALPGDAIEITDGKVYLNDKELNESYIKEQYTDGEIERTVVPDNKLFVMGDNRSYSRDSREADIGFVDMDELRGKAIFRIYPFSDIGIIE